MCDAAGHGQRSVYLNTVSISNATQGHTCQTSLTQVLAIGAESDPTYLDVAECTLTKPKARLTFPPNSGAALSECTQAEYAFRNLQPADPPAEQRRKVLSTAWAEICNINWRWFASTSLVIRTSSLAFLESNNLKTMHFTKVFTVALAAITATATAIPDVEKRDVGAPAIQEFDKRDVGAIVGSVENLVGTIITDVEKIADAAGVNITDILKKVGLTVLGKRELEIAATVNNEQRDLSAVLAAVEGLVSDILAGVGSITSAAGLGSLLSDLKN